MKIILKNLEKEGYSAAIESYLYCYVGRVKEGSTKTYFIGRGNGEQIKCRL